MNPLSNPLYLMPPLLTFIVCLILSILVWRGARQNRSTWIFFSFLLSIGLWSLLTYGMRSSNDLQHALLWEKALIVPAYAAYVFYYHFTLTYTNTRGQISILLGSYILITVVIILAPTNLLVHSMRLEDYGYAANLGPITFLIMSAGLLLVGSGTYNLFRRYNLSSSYEERNRLLYLVIAAFFPSAGAIIDAFSNLPPASIWGNLIFCIICSIAILKYHLLDIRIILRRSLAYLLVSLIIALPYVGVILLLNYILKARMEPWWVHAIIILLLAILLRPLYSWAQNFVDKLFYRDRYDYLKALQQFSQKAQSVINLEELSSTLTHLISNALRTSSVYLLLPSESDDGLSVASSSGSGSPLSGAVLRNSSPLIKWLKRQQHILSSEEFNIVPQLQNLALRERDNLKQIGAELYVPIQTSPSQLSGILILGQKLSRQPYSGEDRQLLTTLGGQMAIALENARLYNKSQKEVKERKRAEEALQKSQEKLQQIFESVTDGILVIDLNGVITEVNRRLADMHGFHSKDDLVGKSALELIAPRDHKKIAKDMRKTLRQGIVRGVEYTLLKADGSKFLGELSTSVLKDASGHPIGYVTIARDITEHKQAEERERRLQQEIYESSRLSAIGELAAGVAHEINNPLTAVVGFSQRILRKSHDESLTRDLERINGEALRTAKIVQNLLSFARRRKPEREDCDINNALQKTLELRGYELTTSNIEVVVNSTPNLPKVRVDFQQIQEVFLNIILNAEQAMVEAHDGGKLIIKTSKNEGYVQIAFSDNGPGIPKENLGDIFSPFFSTRANRGGTGLGLSICHGIVIEHGGKIHVKSQLREGTTFIVELPIATSEASKSKTPKTKSTKTLSSL